MRIWDALLRAGRLRLPRRGSISMWIDRISSPLFHAIRSSAPILPPLRPRSPKPCTSIGNLESRTSGFETGSQWALGRDDLGSAQDSALRSHPNLAIPSSQRVEPRRSESELNPNSVTGRPPPPPRWDLDVLLWNEDYCVVNKFHDMRIDGKFNITVKKLIETRRGSCPTGASWAEPLRNCHQLDYATSGVMVWAFNRSAAARASKGFQYGRVSQLHIGYLRVVTN